MHTGSWYGSICSTGQDQFSFGTELGRAQVPARSLVRGSLGTVRWVPCSLEPRLLGERALPSVWFGRHLQQAPVHTCNPAPKPQSCLARRQNDANLTRQSSERQFEGCPPHCGVCFPATPGPGAQWTLFHGSLFCGEYTHERRKMKQPQTLQRSIRAAMEPYCVRAAMEPHCVRAAMEPHCVRVNPHTGSGVGLRTRGFRTPLCRTH